MGAPIGDDEDIAKFDVTFENWKKKNPGKAFSDFSAERIVRHLNLGRSHASLGNNLNSGKAWKEDGVAPFHALCEFLTSSTDLDALPRDFMVCDYGCGTLRLGWHLMNHLQPGHYCGLDLKGEIIEFGRQDCKALVAAKAPVLGSFKECMPLALDMNVDLVFAFNVACHIHPDEIDKFYSNIRQLCSKPGSLAIIHVITHSQSSANSVRYQRSGWAWSLDHVRDAMKPLQIVNEIRFKDLKKGRYDLVSYYLVAQCPENSAP